MDSIFVIFNVSQNSDGYTGFRFISIGIDLDACKKLIEIQLEDFKEKDKLEGTKRKDGSVVPLMNVKNNYTHIGLRTDFPEFYEERFSGFLIEKVSIINMETLIALQEAKLTVQKILTQIK